MTAEVADFWQRAVQSLRTSEALVESDSDAAASRAYFAAFYAISALFASRGERFTKHAAVERSVHRDLVKPGILPVEVGAAFSWLSNLRHTGDYGGQDHVLPEDAETAVARARLILETVRSVAPEPLPELDL